MADHIYSTITDKKEKEKKQIAVLIDPDTLCYSADPEQAGENQIAQIAEAAQLAEVDYFFVGGSILTNGNIKNCIKVIKENCSIPAILFPGSALQIHNSADAILFLSLISGRNPEMLIGKHVIAAPVLKSPEYSGLEVLPTGYMLIESGNSTAVSYMSNTTPIPGDKSDIAVCTAMAGELLGLKLIYMDGGSGAAHPISESMISKVSQSISVPLIIGGGIRTPEEAVNSCKAGADVIVVGNAIEGNVLLVKSISEAVHSV
ncbi:geranylgeranylglyceryl/heptaprenylglyceryl phosphate synthase [bacterium AH-315-M05]|nr:geranylgeranylglyceryl/heptaprenylglyceryl phosphate synthase [bacterium AH-315-M05]